MKSFGINNWIKYGWGEDMNDTKSSNDELYIDFSNHTKSNLTPNEAAIETVNEIVRSYPAPYTLMCSGGLDSQAMMYSWYISNQPFNIVSVRYKSEDIFFNEHDLIELDIFAKKLKLEITYKDFDILSFLENDLPLVVKDNECDSPQICTHIKMTEFIKKGTILFSGNIIHCGFPVINNTMLGMHRYAMLNFTPERKIIPFFLLHNPNLAFAFDKNCKSNIHKTEYYYDFLNIPIVIPPDKYTGFEKVKDYYDKYHGRVSSATRLKYIDKPSRRVFDLLFRHPYGEIQKVTSKIFFERDENGSPIYIDR